MLFNTCISEEDITQAILECDSPRRSEALLFLKQKFSDFIADEEPVKQSLHNFFSVIGAFTLDSTNVKPDMDTILACGIIRNKPLFIFFSHLQALMDVDEMISTTAASTTPTAITFSTEKDEDTLRPTDSCYTNSFNSTLIGNGVKDRNRLISMIRNLNLYIDNWNMHSPSIIMCQSSGYGKSKLACSLASTFPTSYSVMRAEREYAFPLGTTISQELLNIHRLNYSNNFGGSDIDDCLVRYNNTGRALFFLYSLLTSYSKYYLGEGRSPEEVSSMFVNGAFRFNYPIDSCLMTFSELKEEIISKIQAISTTFANGDGDNSSNKGGRGADAPTTAAATLQRYPFVFIFDEVSKLRSDEKVVDSYRHLRRAAHYMGVSANFVILLLGTTTDFFDLSPILSQDSIRLTKRVNFMPPFIVSENFDIFSSKWGLGRLGITHDLLKSSRMPLILLSLGRPLWSSITLEHVPSLAKAKLINLSLDSGDSNFACWMVRTGVTANPFGLSLTRTLVKSLMATVFSISQDLLTMNIGYPSEPVLAVAARGIIDNNELSHFKALLKHLQLQSCDVGRVAEIISMEIVLEAITKADRIVAFHPSPPQSTKQFLLENDILNFSPKISSSVPSYFYHLTTVEAFLSSLYGSSFINVIKGKLSVDLKEAIINCSHFIPVNNKFNFEKAFENSNVNIFVGLSSALPAPPRQDLNVIDRALLNFGLLRQCGFIMPPNYYGIDYIIPICFKDGSLSFIGMQVKASKSNLDTCLSKMRITDHYIGLHSNNNNTKTILHNQLMLLMTMSTKMPSGKPNKKILKISDEHTEAAKANKEKNWNAQEKKIMDDEGFTLEDSLLVHKTKFNFALEVAHVNGGDGIKYSRTIAKDGSQLFGIRSKNLHSFKHLWTPSTAVIDCLRTILDHQSDPLDSVDATKSFKRASKAQIILSQISNPSYVEVNGMIREMRGDQALPEPFDDVNFIYSSNQ